MLKLYQNKDWLETKYNKEQLSDPKIAKICNTSLFPIWNWRKKFIIESRSCGESIHLSKVNHCSLSKRAVKWINGELLGDGNLTSYSNYSAKVFYGSKFFEYIQYISKTLKSFDIKQCGRIYKRYHKELERYYYFYASLTYEELLSLRKKWYPQGKKIVPRDLELTPITCRQWYIGDGSLGRTSSGNPVITLYTQGFPIPDVEFLKEELVKLGLETTRQPAGNILHISTKSTLDFLNYIGPCPVSCYKYKWTIGGDN